MGGGRAARSPTVLPADDPATQAPPSPQLASRARTLLFRCCCIAVTRRYTGSISAISTVHPTLGVIWIDAHADANTPASSPSMHYHGMPAAHLLGWFDKKQPVPVRARPARTHAHTLTRRPNESPTRMYNSDP